MQLLSGRHGGTELQQLQGNAVLQVDLWGLAAAEAAQEAQAWPRPLPGRHGGCGGTGSSGDVGPGMCRRGPRGREGEVERTTRLLSRGHDLEKREEGVIYGFPVSRMHCNDIQYIRTSMCTVRMQNIFMYNSFIPHNSTYTPQM